MSTGTPEYEINLISEDGLIPDAGDIEDLVDGDHQAKLDKMLQKGQLQGRPDRRIRSRVRIQRQGEE